MRTAHEIVIRPIITEDSMERLAGKAYTFEVAAGSNKVEIKKAVEEVFGVKVADVNTMRVEGKMKRMGRTMGYRPDRKKAIVTLEGDKTIEFFDGMY